MIAGNSDSIFKRLMAEIDGVIGQWTAQHTVDEVLAALDRASVPAGRIYTVAEIAQDPHYQARDMLQTVRMDDGSDLMVPGIVPKLSRSPGGGTAAMRLALVKTAMPCSRAWA